MPIEAAVAGTVPFAPAGDGDWLIPDWPAPAAVRAVVTTRRGPGVSLPPHDAFDLGDRCGDDPEAVRANRAALVQALGLPAAPRWLRQVHGVRTVRFERRAVPGALAADASDAPEADAAVTAAPGVVLAVLTADCVPVLFCAEDGREIGVAHAGWRGLAGGVLESCVARLQTPAQGLLAWLGPAIGPASYEVGDAVRDAFLAHDAAAADAFRATRPGHWLCDLYRLARQRLAACGIRRVHGGREDTVADPRRWYSHRRDGVTGRMASVVWISP